jgi:ABC-type sugar transport system permease subunit
LANYQTVLKDKVFWVSFRNTLVIAAWAFTIPFFMPILIAEAIFNLKSARAKNFYRVAILIPLLVPGIVNLMLWKWMYTYPEGGINLILTAVGLGDLTRPWLALMSTALPALLFMGFPWVTGTAPLIYLAGLMNIPPEVLDATQIDGCSLFQRVIHVDLPHIVGQIRLFLIFDIIGVLQGFGTQLALTRGGPSNATMVPGLYVYKKAFGLERFEMAYPEMGAACAVAVILFVVIFALTFVANKYARITGISSD